MEKTEIPAVCGRCKASRARTDLIPIQLISGPIKEFIKVSYPDAAAQGLICPECLNQIRAAYVEALLAKEKGELSHLENDVVRSFHQQDVLTRNINDDFDRNLTMGQRVADKVAEFGGSWKFIFIFGGTLLGWILLNSSMLMRQPFDPFPFILLNLILSCLAAVQAPIIMMSQNRHAEKDRLQADHDYRTNLKAELEIRQLNAKVDQLMMRHWQRLLEIQAVQTELMEQIAAKDKNKSGQEES